MSGRQNCCCCAAPLVEGSAQTAVIAAAERSEHTVNTFFEDYHDDYYVEGSKIKKFRTMLQVKVPNSGFTLALAHERLEWQSLTFQAEAWEQAMQWLQYANDEKAASSCR
eukprot:1389315-Amphidinium_carterae.3